MKDSDLNPDAARRSMARQAEKDFNPEDSFPPAAEALREWAARPIAFEPLDPRAITAGHSASMAYPARRWFPGKAVWTLAAAALLMLAVGQLRFTIDFDDAQFHWGRGTDSPVAAKELDEIKGRLAELTDHSARTQAELERLAQFAWTSNNALKATVASLEAAQQLESLTRLRDMRHIVELAAADRASDFAEHE
jgi:hypothetical protein